MTGGGAAGAVVLQDFTSAATGFFTGVRVPAGLVAGSSLGALFILKNLTSPADLAKRSKSEQICIKFYHVFILLSFILSLTAIVIATASVVTILHGRFDPKAETAYLLLKREFEFEFVLTRWSFLSSLLSFIVGVTNRVMLEFDLLKKERRNWALAVLFAMTALVTNILSYLHSTLYCWPNLFMMTGYVAKLIIRRALEEKRPLQFLSLISASLAAYFGFKGVFTDPLKYKDDDVSTP